MDLARWHDRGGLPGRRRILVADDAPLNRQIAKALLERNGFDVRLAADGAEAVEAAAGDGAFALVLMDLDMPVMDGFEAAAAIRGLGPARGGMPIVALVPAARRADIGRACEAGMTGHLAKPFNPASFVRDVEGLIGRAVQPDRPGRPIWDRQIFEELVRRLGAARVEPCLSLFESQLRRARAGLSRPGVPAAEVAHEAHAFVSSAGVLGFADLCAVSGEAQHLAGGLSAEPRADETGTGRLVAELLGAIDRTLACVSQVGFARPAGA